MPDEPHNEQITLLHLPPLQLTIWHEFTDHAPYESEEWATTDRGWLLTPCAPWDYSRQSEYNDRTMPIFDDELGCWREQSSAGNYLDYGPLREVNGLLPPGKYVHAVCYLTHQSGYFATVNEAKEWIEAEVRKVRV